MGLDVRAVKNAKQVEDPRVSEVDDLDQICHGHFPKQAGNLGDGDYYDGEETEWFFNMSYGNYGAFREMLAEVAGYEKTATEKPEPGADDFENKLYFYNRPHIATAWKAEEGPFIELIQFSDCEGYICAEICQKLYKDFSQFLPAVEAAWNFAQVDKYKDLMAAFEFGAKNGYVKFT
jgi:hypothetical protein